MKPFEYIGALLLAVLAYLGMRFGGGLEGALAPIMMFVLAVASSLIGAIRER